MRIGILGNGQLARMLALAGRPLGLDFAFYSPNPDGCANVLGEHVCGGFHDIECLGRFVDSVDIVTFENENISQFTLDAIPAERISPPAVSILTAQDRFTEKQYLEKLGIAVPEYCVIGCEQELLDALHDNREPLIVKTRYQGYDGRGQARVHTVEDVQTAWLELGNNDLIVEAMVKFDREVSVIAVRSHGGEVRFYPVTENHHHHGILIASVVRRNDPLQAKAEDYTRRLMEDLDYVGVLGLEFFDYNGELLANEFAPRVHNSGHWSIDGAVCSQFENHLRAICDLPLGDTSALAPCAMCNIIGEYPALPDILKLSGAHYHHYQKQPRPGRKTGHITVCAHDDEAVSKMVSRIMKMFGQG